MTNRLPPDLDRLLWEVAESQDSAAYDDFEARFPHLVVELGKRIKLVRELRDARAGVNQRRPLPSFDRRQPTPMLRFTPALAAMAAILFVALGYGAYTLTTRTIDRPAKAVVISEPPAPSPTPLPPQNEQHPTPTPPRKDTADNNPPSEPAPAYSRPQDVRFERAKLQVALAAVAYNGGLTIEFAPNTPNPEIRMDYAGASAIDILKDLGAKFGFTAFDQGNRHVLIVPARDPNVTDQPSVSGTATNLDADNTSSTPQIEAGKTPKVALPKHPS